MKKCQGCGSISNDDSITCGVCGTNIANTPLLEGSIEDEIIRDQEKTQKENRPLAQESAQRSRQGLAEFFRHCPECGRRFHIKLESKKRLSLDRETIHKPGVARTAGYAGVRGAGYRGVGGRLASGPVYLPQRIILTEGEPVIIDIEELQYNYKCKHCGHEWSEKRIEKHKES